MWNLLRVVLFEWILARIGLGWLLSLLVLVPLALFFFIGIPTLLVIGAVVFLLWRAVRRNAPRDAAAPAAEST
jgi:Na+-translocating ferredoxin:NAD+ oxidoreductase RnfA subunit